MKTAVQRSRSRTDDNMPRFAVGDLVWHYDNGLIREDVIAEVSTSTFGGKTWLLGYRVARLDVVKSGPTFVHTGDVYARPAERVQVAERFVDEIESLQDNLEAWKEDMTQEEYDEVGFD